MCTVDLAAASASAAAAVASAVTAAVSAVTVASAASSEVATAPLRTSDAVRAAVVVRPFCQMTSTICLTAVRPLHVAFCRPPRA